MKKIYICGWELHSYFCCPFQNSLTGLTASKIPPTIDKSFMNFPNKTKSCFYQTWNCLQSLFSQGNYILRVIYYTDILDLFVETMLNARISALWHEQGIKTSRLVQENTENSKQHAEDMWPVKDM